MSSTEQERLQLDSLIAKGDIAVVFQPIVDMQDGSIAAMEALCRPGVESGFASPAHLFRAAEELGRLWELESVTRAAAFRAASSWPAGRQLFLNSSPVVFADERFTDSICSLADKTPGLGRGRLVLEITELSEETHTELLVARAQELKLAGFGVAVDDAGAGTSGLNRIMSIRPHWIKLDREFVRNIHTDIFRQNLVRFFVQFARLSNISVVAEGIESAEELAMVASLGVRFAQGYYLARPAAIDPATADELAQNVRDRWQTIERAAATGGGWATPNTAGVERLVLAVPTLAAERTAETARDELAANPAAPGVIITESGRAVGWVARESIEQVCDDGSELTTLEHLMTWPMLRVPPAATLQEALEVSCVLEEQGPADPLLVAGGGKIYGIIRLRDLIRAATREGRVGAGQTGIAHLASRVQTDRHVADIVTAWKDSSADAQDALHADAAFVDIRRFSECNAAYGYPFGDRLIRTLAEHIEAEVAGPIHTCFLAHLGEDRFLLTAPAGQLESRLRNLIARFDEFAAQINDPARPGRPDVVARLNSDRAPTISLRVVLMSGVLPAITHSRDLYRREQLVRQATVSRAGLLADADHSRSLLILDPVFKNPERTAAAG